MKHRGIYAACAFLVLLVGALLLQMRADFLRPPALRPTRATASTYRELIELDNLPLQTREIYDAVISHRLVGKNARDYEQLLRSAQRITTRSSGSILYEFQLNRFTRTYDKVFEEGVPMLFVLVDNRTDVIYAADVTAPEF